VVAMMLGIAYLFLRYSALQGRGLVEAEIARFGNRRLRKLTGLSTEQIHAHLEQIRTWPLRWPRLNQTMLATFAVLAGLVFYKLGFVLCMAALIFVIYYSFTAMTHS